MDLIVAIRERLGATVAGRRQPDDDVSFSRRERMAGKLRAVNLRLNPKTISQVCVGDHLLP